MIEDTLLAFEQHGTHWELVLLTIMIIVSIAGYNITGQSVIKYASSSQRATIEQTRILLVWMISLCTKKEVFSIL